jgi:hypothetical protein
VYIILALTPAISALITAVVLYIINKNTDLPGQGPYTAGYNLVATSDTNPLVEDMDEPVEA